MRQEELEERSKLLIKKHHKSCLFRGFLRDGSNLSFSFDKKGNLSGRFFCHKKYQGYDDRIHGGVIAAIIDESMVHCLMGHGTVGVTTSLAIKYRLPVFIGKYAEFKTKVDGSFLNGTVYELSTDVFQDKKNVITARSKFYTGFEDV